MRFAEKQYLCGRKAVIAFVLGPRHQLLDEEVPPGRLARRQVGKRKVTFQQLEAGLKCSR